MPAFYIYALFCDKTDDIVYVGQSQYPYNRFSAHKSSIKRVKKPVYKHFRKHRSIPTLVIIERVYSDFVDDRVFKAEAFWINILYKCGFGIKNISELRSRKPREINESIIL